MFELPAAIPVAIGSLDALIVVVYLAATTLLGIWLGRGQKNNRDYFLGRSPAADLVAAAFDRRHGNEHGDVSERARQVVRRRRQLHVSANRVRLHRRPVRDHRVSAARRIFAARCSPPTRCWSSASASRRGGWRRSCFW